MHKIAGYYSLMPTDTVHRSVTVTKHKIETETLQSREKGRVLTYFYDKGPIPTDN